MIGSFSPSESSWDLLVAQSSIRPRHEAPSKKAGDEAHRRFRLRAGSRHVGARNSSHPYKESRVPKKMNRQIEREAHQLAVTWEEICRQLGLARDRELRQSFALKPDDRQRAKANNRLLEEVGRWVKAMGGVGTVAGPIRLVTWPEDQYRNLCATGGVEFFAVDVRIMGRRPTLPGPILPPAQEPIPSHNPVSRPLRASPGGSKGKARPSPRTAKRYTKATQKPTATPTATTPKRGRVKRTNHRAKKKASASVDNAPSRG
jgi:hypothetical protein